MDRFVAFLDVGYLDAASASTLKKDKRKITAKPDEWVGWLRDAGENLPGAPTFLRAYWYDGAYDPRHPNYKAQRSYLDRIAEVPGIQLRLGHLKVKKTPKWHYAVKIALRNMGVDEVQFEEHFEFRPELEQKGVDTRITLDIVRLAQRHVYDAAILVAGDRDLAEPVQLAQQEGCRMILAVPDGGSVAWELRQIADEVRHISKAELKKLFVVES
ncbi:MAG TPA: NYN domain-containing protein [Solirubrobacterales bacterium]|nr:NYN domain-containing protein [Solirubrobacterales bacterium]